MGTIGLTHQVSKARDSDCLNSVELGSVPFMADGDIESYLHDLILSEDVFVKK